MSARRFVLLPPALAAAAALRRRASLTRTAAAAASAERARIARDLHDGVAQELASIRRNLQWLDPGDPNVARAASAADRALADVRRVIASVGDESAGPLATVLRDIALHVAEREQANIELDLDDSLTVEPERARGLAMIASEALTNASRHGAGIVRLSLSRRDGVHLEITDDGPGIEAARLAHGFGMRAMGERATEIGARMELESAPGRGTRLGLTL